MNWDGVIPLEEIGDARALVVAEAPVFLEITACALNRSTSEVKAALQAAGRRTKVRDIFRRLSPKVPKPIAEARTVDWESQTVYGFDGMIAFLER